MQYQSDFIMRQIEMIINMLIKLLFKEENADDAAEIILKSVNGELWDELEKLLAEHEFCDAEDLLFERIENSDENLLSEAVRFYYELNKFTDNELEENDFSRDEIAEGLRDVCEKYGTDVVL